MLVNIYRMEFSLGAKSEQKESRCRGDKLGSGTRETAQLAPLAHK